MMKQIETRKVEQVDDLIPDEKSWKKNFDFDFDFDF